MSTRARWILTLSLAALIGLGIALLFAPRIQRRAMLNAIVSDDPAERERAWSWWSEADSNGETRAAGSLDAINRTIADTHAEQLVPISDTLRGLDLWGWSQQPEALLFRELFWRAAVEDAPSQRVALDTLRVAPPATDSTMFAWCVNDLLAADDQQIARESLEMGIMWLAANSPGELADLDVPTDHTALIRTWVLACMWAALPPPDAASSQGGESLDITEARIMAEVLRSPDDTSAVIEVIRNWPADSDQPAFANILRHGTDSGSWQHLERLARAGDASATYAQQARSNNREIEQARLVLADAAADIRRRKLAAWRLRTVDVQQITQLLTVPGTDPAEPVYADVLLAERHLPPTEAAALAEQWIRSFDDRRKRAGALLAALLDEHADLLTDAYRAEDIPQVRTIQYLALQAMGQDVNAKGIPGQQPTENAVDPSVLAHRALHLEDGDFDPDIALTLLMAGDEQALRLLTSQPQGDLGSSVQQRAWLIERFVPNWHERLGRPIGGSMRGVRLHFDALNALRLVTQRGLVFDAPSRLFQ